MFKFLTAASVILALLFSAVPAAAGDYRYRDRGHRSDYYAPNWRYDSPGHEYRRFDNYDRREYRDWRNTYHDHSYYHPMPRNRLVIELNNQGFYWVYNIRPSHRDNYITAFAYDRQYAGRSVYLRVNQYNGRVFYFRYTN